MAPLERRNYPPSVIPAKAGIHSGHVIKPSGMPAFAVAHAPRNEDAKFAAMISYAAEYDVTGTGLNTTMRDVGTC
jgi:hypothetical protein